MIRNISLDEIKIMIVKKASDINSCAIWRFDIAEMKALSQQLSGYIAEYEYMESMQSEKGV